MRVTDLFRATMLNRPKRAGSKVETSFPQKLFLLLLIQTCCPVVKKLQRPCKPLEQLLLLFIVSISVVTSCFCHLWKGRRLVSQTRWRRFRSELGKMDAEISDFSDAVVKLKLVCRCRQVLLCFLWSCVCVCVFVYILGVTPLTHSGQTTWFCLHSVSLHPAFFSFKAKAQNFCSLRLLKGVAAV